MRNLTALMVTLVIASGYPAHAGGLAEIRLIDRDTGAALQPHYYRGEYWVAGRPGARYAIEVQSRHGERLLAVTSVDGVNVLSGETAAWSQTGYVFDPWEHYQITGWRKSDQEVAAFTFTALPNSYAARTGRPENVGVIGVALFRERPQPAVSQAYGDTPPMPSSAAPAAPGAALADLSRAQAARESAMAPQAKLGTGHGPRETSFVQHTEFQRLHDRPDQVVNIHYDSTANLVAMGIIPGPPQQPPVPNPFPGSSDRYVPDPPG